MYVLNHNTDQQYEAIQNGSAHFITSKYLHQVCAAAMKSFVDLAPLATQWVISRWCLQLFFFHYAYVHPIPSIILVNHLQTWLA